MEYNTAEDLDTEVAGYLRHVRSRPPAHLLSIAELRRDIDRLKDFYPPRPVGAVENIEIPGPAGKIPLRIYIPEGKGPFTPVVYFHGGGWCIGSLDSCAGACAELAYRIPAVVFSAGYRLAPEHPFPAAVDDCYAALKYAAAHAARFGASPERLAVMGDSAGGNLAAVICLKSAREGGPHIDKEVLIYPATDLSRNDFLSYRLFGKGYDLDREMIGMFESNYLRGGQDRTDPYVSPALAEGLESLPPTLIIAAEYDPLRDDATEFTDKLKKAGVSVKCSVYKGVIHGFTSFTSFRAAQKAFDEIMDFLSGSRS